MKNLVQYITTYSGMNLNVFLVVDNDSTYLISYESVHRFGAMCPCCILEEHHKAITRELKVALQEGKISKEITWCSYRDYAPHFGNTANEFFLELTQLGIKFKGGSADRISTETMEMLDQEVDKLSA